jgi:Domain of unknown function (DUF6285)
MQDRPNVLELLAAVRGFLEDDVVPALEGRPRFLALVSANVLGIVGRELEGEEESLLAEWRGLARLLGVHDDPPVRLAALRTAVLELTERLADRIRRGDADHGPWAEALRTHVRETVTEKLRVANPRYLRP